MDQPTTDEMYEQQLHIFFQEGAKISVTLVTGTRITGQASWSKRWGALTLTSGSKEYVVRKSAIVCIEMVV